MKNKKIIIIEAIVLVLIICLIVFFKNMSYFFTKLYVDNIKYDIGIYNRKGIVNADVHIPVSYYTYRLINIKEKRLYLISGTENIDTGEKTIKCETNELDDSQISQIKMLYNKEKYQYSNEKELMFGTRDYYKIEIKNEGTYTTLNLPFSIW